MSKILTRQIYLTTLIIQIFGGIFLENFIKDKKSAVGGRAGEESDWPGREGRKRVEPGQGRGGLGRSGRIGRVAKRAGMCFEKKLNLYLQIRNSFKRIQGGAVAGG
jgi:hypothetical protein